MTIKPPARLGILNHGRSLMPSLMAHPGLSAASHLLPHDARAHGTGITQALHSSTPTHPPDWRIRLDPQSSPPTAPLSFSITASTAGERMPSMWINCKIHDIQTNKSIYTRIQRNKNNLINLFDFFNLFDIIESGIQIVLPTRLQSSPKRR